MIDANEQRSDVAFVKVFGHIFRDGRFAILQQLQIAITHFGRDLIADVQQLTEMRIELRTGLIVTQSVDELFRA